MAILEGVVMTDRPKTLERQAGESVPEFAARMIDVVRLINSIVQSHAGMLINSDIVIEHLDFIVEHGGDPAWGECWELRQKIDRVCSRMMSPSRLQRILYFAKEMSK